MIKGFAIAVAALAAIGFIGGFGLFLIVNYWWLLIIIAALGGGGIFYMKKQRAVANRV